MEYNHHPKWFEPQSSFPANGHQSNEVKNNGPVLMVNNSLTDELQK
jgi:hypothetical protein